jgi:deoxyribose-phosphate aldolase
VEAARAMGAREIDLVVALPALLAGDHRAVYQDLAALVEAAGEAGLKVILETCLLSPEQKAAGAALAAAAGAAYVKTSTGFAGGGATEEDVRILRATVGPRLGVKASGGIRSAAEALRMVLAGASRIGCSASVAIVEASAF